MTDVSGLPVIGSAFNDLTFPTNHVDERCFSIDEICALRISSVNKVLRGTAFHFYDFLMNVSIF